MWVGRRVSRPSIIAGWRRHRRLWSRYGKAASIVASQIWREILLVRWFGMHCVFANAGSMVHHRICSHVSKIGHRHLLRGTIAPEKVVCSQHWFAEMHLLARAACISGLAPFFYAHEPFWLALKLTGKMAGNTVNAH